MQTINIVTTADTTRITGKFEGVPVIEDEIGELHRPSRDWAPYEFNYSMKESDKLFTVKPTTSLENYTLKTAQPSLKQSISEEVFTQLPTALQSLYQRVESQGEELLPVEAEISFISLVAYAQANPTLFVLSRSEVITELERLNFKLNRNSMVSSHSNGMREEPSLKVVLFQHDWEGTTKKLLARKANGRPYADQRGRVVPDYPEISETVTIPNSLIPRFQATTEEELEQRLQAYYRFITEPGE